MSVPSEIVNNAINNGGSITATAINYIILTLLGLMTLRDIVGLMGVVKYDDSFLSNLVYGRYDKQIIKRTLRELGYNNETKVKKGNKVLALQSELNIKACDKGINIKKLTFLVSEYILKFDQDITYGKNTPVSTKYFINTMEASKNPESLQKMIELIHYLVYLEVRNGTLSGMPDFILTPKNGNPLIGSAYADRYEIMSIFAKSKHDRSRSTFKRTNMLNYQTNFEGAIALSKLESLNITRELIGVAIDCNVSGGTQILEMMKDFNDCIKTHSLNIEPIKVASVLFKVDKKDINIDRKFAEENFVIKRFFDIDEESKKALYNLKVKCTDQFSCDAEKDISYFLDKVKIIVECEDK